jgi:hypothetical protein
VRKKSRVLADKVSCGSAMERLSFGQRCSKCGGDAVVQQGLAKSSSADRQSTRQGLEFSYLLIRRRHPPSVRDHCIFQTLKQTPLNDFRSPGAPLYVIYRKTKTLIVFDTSGRITQVRYLHWGCKQSAIGILVARIR